jgi:fatty acyl-CoA reductase
LYFVSQQVFDTIRQNQKETLNKLVAVAGDVMLPEFGLSPSDLELLIENVSIVFNSAATVKFDEELQVAVEMNVNGPKRLLEICRQMKQLKVAKNVHLLYT